jgi:hypothetical protein
VPLPWERAGGEVPLANHAPPLLRVPNEIGGVFFTNNLAQDTPAYATSPSPWERAGGEVPLANHAPPLLRVPNEIGRVFFTNNLAQDLAIIVTL